MSGIAETAVDQIGPGLMRLYWALPIGCPDNGREQGWLTNDSDLLRIELPDGAQNHPGDILL